MQVLVSKIALTGGSANNSARIIPTSFLIPVSLSGRNNGAEGRRESL